MTFALTPFEPSALPLREAIDQLFNSAFTWPMWGHGDGAGRAGWPMNVYENADGYVVHCLIPGVAPESVNITAHQNVLRIAGKLAHGAPEGYQPVFTEFGDREFVRQVTLPAPFDVDKAEASYQNGILTLTLPKVESHRVRTIPVRPKELAAAA